MASSGSHVSVRQDCNGKTSRVTGIHAGIVRRLGSKGEQLELVVQGRIYSIVCRRLHGQTEKEKGVGEAVWNQQISRILKLLDLGILWKIDFSRCSGDWLSLFQVFQGQ